MFYDEILRCRGIFLKGEYYDILKVLEFVIL